MKQVQQLWRARWWVSLAILVPASILVQVLGFSAVAIFFTSALALIPLAALLGFATEELAGHVGPSLGGLLNGLLVTWAGIPSLVVTLGTLALFRGLANVILGPTVISVWPDPSSPATEWTALTSIISSRPSGGSSAARSSASAGMAAPRGPVRHRW